MKGTDEQCPNSAEVFAIPTSTSAPRFFLQGILMLASVPLLGLVIRPPQAVHFDWSVLDALVAMRTLALTRVMLVMTNVFTPVVVVSWTIVLGGATRVFSGSRREGLIIPMVMVCSSAITAFIKEFIESIRLAFPERFVMEGSHSFPSGRTIAVAATCTAGVFLMPRHLANRIPSDEDGFFPRLPARIIRGSVIVGAITLVVFITFTRLYLGVHQFSDAVTGVLAGTALPPIITELLLGNA